METPGFGLRVGISIVTACAWAAFMLIWLLFYAGSYSTYQNLAAILASVVIAGAILAAAWVSWGIKYGMKYRKEWGKDDANWKVCNGNRSWKGGSGGAVYGLGFLGALVYYVTTATSITAIIIGIVKAILWPAFLTYGLLKLIGA